MIPRRNKSAVDKLGDRGSKTCVTHLELSTRNLLARPVHDCPATRLSEKWNRTRKRSSGRWNDRPGGASLHGAGRSATARKSRYRVGSNPARYRGRRVWAVLRAYGRRSKADRRKAAGYVEGLGAARPLRACAGGREGAKDRADGGFRARADLSEAGCRDRRTPPRACGSQRRFAGAKGSRTRRSDRSYECRHSRPGEWPAVDGFTRCRQRSDTEAVGREPTVTVSSSVARFSAFASREPTRLREASGTCFLQGTAQGRKPQHPAPLARPGSA